MIHMEVKPYECDICGKQFRQKVHHAYHVSHKHRDQNETNSQVKKCSSKIQKVSEGLVDTDLTTQES